MASFRSIIILALLLAVIQGCQYAPNQIRSTLKSANIYQFVQEGSIDFTRNNDHKSGNLKFSLTDTYKCSVIFWAEDLNEDPAADSPMTFPCPEGDIDITIYFTELEPLVPYSFKIIIWPEKLTSASSAFIVLRESKNLEDLKTDTLIINNFVAPRLSAETYVFSLAEKETLNDIREQINNLYRDSVGTCSQTRPLSDSPFSYDKSSQKNSEDPFLGLDSLYTDGYSRGLAQKHKFFNNRYVTDMSTSDNNQKFSWFFTWEGQNYGFMTFPPVQFVEFSATVKEGTRDISYRSLKGTQPVFSYKQQAPEFSYSIIYPGHVQYLHLQIRNPFNDSEAIYCVFKGDKTKFSIPSEIYQNLDNGTYELTAIIEAIQVHYKSNLAYPPWVITYQDMIHSKFEKVL